MSGGLSALGPIEQRTLSDMVTARIRDAIMQGELLPGQRLKEPELAEALDVSRSPVREALARLRGEGLVVGTASSYVWQPTQAQVKEVLSIQMTLQNLAAEWLLTEHGLTEEDLAKLQSLIDDWHQTLDTSPSVSPAAIISAEEVFQGYLLRRSGLALVTRLWRQTISQWRVLMHTYLRNCDSNEVAQDILSAHRAILDALCEGDLAAIRDQYRAIRDKQSLQMEQVL
ncbi:MAG: GntR family transcriptional regulator [Anaerolineae bacterium]